MNVEFNKFESDLLNELLTQYKDSSEGLVLFGAVLKAALERNEDTTEALPLTTTTKEDDDR